MIPADDQLAIMFLGADDLMHEQASGIRLLVKSFDATPGLRPDWVRVGKKRVAFAEKSCADALLKDRAGDSRFLTAGRDSAPGVEMTFSFLPDDPLGTQLDARMPLVPFTEAGEGAARLSPLVVDWFRALAALVTPVYAFAHSLADGLLSTDPHWSDPYTEKQVYEIYWLNLYGADLVQRIGRDRLDSMSSASREWLPGGGVLFTAYPNPAEVLTKGARRAQAKIHAQLSPGADPEPELERRNAKLAPVAAAFDPDVAELLDMIVLADDVGHRPGVIARFNQFQPPPVAERRSELSPDVDDVEGIVRLYRDRYAERLVALLHGEIPAIMDGRPEVLPRVDYHFWRGDYPRLFKREDIDGDLVPSVGAFLGEMIVRHLRGIWIPRQNIYETGVAVGENVWLPFLRARRYFANRDAVIDYSLTQLYRAAARS